MKSNGEKERYIHLNAEFQRIAGEDKAFLISRGNNIMRKTRELFKKTEIPKEIFIQKWALLRAEMVRT